MLSILALIGKIILMIILSILIVLLLLVTILLFVPVRYKAAGQFNAYQKPNFQCDLSSGWLLNLIHIRFYTIEDEQFLIFRIFGIKDSSYKKFFSFFHRSSLKKGKQSENKTVATDLKNTGISKDIIENKEANDIPEFVKTELNESFKGKEGDDENNQIPSNEMNDENSDSNKKNHKRKFSFDGFKKLLKDGEALKKKIKHYYRILTSDICKESFHVCKDRFIKVLKYILPKKAKVNIYFGFDDPSVTGNILAIHGILYALLSDIIILHPDFDQEMFYGDFRLKGRIRLCTLLYHLLRIYFDDNCKRFYRIIKKEMNHGR